MSNNSTEKIIDKIYNYIQKIINKFSLSINPKHILTHLQSDLPENLISYEDVLNYTASYCSNYISEHYDYDTLSAELLLKYIRNKTENTYEKVLEKLKKYNIINDEYYNSATKYLPDIEKLRKKEYHSNTFFGVKTFLQSYLSKYNNEIIERVQDLYIRQAFTIHPNNLSEAFMTYIMLLNGYYTQATPTLHNAGKKNHQLASCFLLGTEDDLEEIYKTISKSALISKKAGGIGIHFSNIRASGTRINGTGGNSRGLIALLKVFNASIKYSHQGGIRKGAYAAYLEPWHADFPEFLKLRLNSGNPEERAYDTFTAIWMCDLFMERVEQDAEWSLMCPYHCPGLSDVYGEEFDKLYEKYEKEQKYVKKVKAKTLWLDILKSQIETGTPYMLYKDSINKKSNQKNIGVIKSSNLCTEIVEVSTSKEFGTCNLASISLPKFVEDGVFNHKKLFEVVCTVIDNLNNIIDITTYPVEESKTSNLAHRPIGIGVQGLYDVFMIMKYPYESRESLILDAEIFETIYYASLYQSCQLSKKYGPYSTFKGSPMSEGILQYHFWNVKPTKRWDWNKLIQDIKKYGVRNSLLTTCMPTASTSQILGNTEATEPLSSNIYNRDTQAGSFIVINKYLMKDLIRLELWNKNIKDKLIYYNGSISKITEIPLEIRNLYKTVWEIDQKFVIDHAKIRSPFIDQSQSMNLYLSNPTNIELTRLHFYGWMSGLKTGLYYLRSRPVTDVTKFNLDIMKIKEIENEKKILCSKENKGACEMCSS